MRDMLLATFWLVAIPMSFASPPAGVLFWVWDALLAPTELVFGFMASVPTNKLIALSTIASLAMKREARDLYIDRIGYLLVGLAFVATISWLTAIVPLGADDDLYSKILKEIALAFVVMSAIKAPQWIHLFIYTLVISISFLGVKEGLISLMTVGGHKIVGSRALGDNNQLAAALVMIIPMVLYLARYSKSPTLKWCLLGALFLDVTTVIMTFSRGGFIGLLVVAVMLVKGSRSRVRTLILVAGLGLIVWSIAPDTWFSRVNTIETAASQDDSFTGRLVAWKISWLIASEYPFFGGGMHAVQHGPVWYRFSQDLPKLDFIPTPPPDLFPHAAHSIYFEILGDMGFSGLFIFLLLGFCAWLNLRSIRKTAAGNLELVWAFDLASALETTLVSYAVTGAALSIAYFELFFVVLALTSRCRRTVRLLQKRVRDQAVDIPLGQTSSRELTTPRGNEAHQRPPFRVQPQPTRWL